MGKGAVHDGEGHDRAGQGHGIRGLALGRVWAMGGRQRPGSVQWVGCDA